MLAGSPTSCGGPSTSASDTTAGLGHTFPDGISGPAEVFRRSILCCFITDPVGIENLSHFNVDNVCWESDYPHSDGVWPNGPEVLGELLAGVSDEVVEAITHGNAMRHYQFDPFARRPPDACRVGALRAESPDVDTVTRVGRPAGERDRRAWARIANRVAAAKAGRRPAATPAELS